MIYNRTMQIFKLNFSVYSHPGHHHHEHHDEEESSLIESITDYLANYETSTLALLGTLIVQSVPVILMSIIYKFLDKYVKDTSNSKLLWPWKYAKFRKVLIKIIFFKLPIKSLLLITLKNACKKQNRGKLVNSKILLIQTLIFVVLIL